MATADDPLNTVREFLNRAKGKSLTTIAKQGIGAWMLAVVWGFVTGTQRILELAIIVPAEVFINLIRKGASAFFLEPLGVIETGSNVTSESVGRFGIAGLPVSVVVVLVTFAIVAVYLSYGPTPNLLPNVPIDFATPLFQGPEEDEDEDG